MGKLGHFSCQRIVFIAFICVVICCYYKTLVKALVDELYRTS